MGKSPNYESWKLQPLIAKRDGWKCHYCGCELVYSYEYFSVLAYLKNAPGFLDKSKWEPYLQMQRGAKMATIDHVIPTSRGGSPRNLDNLVLACVSCNSRKSNKIMDSGKQMGLL